MILPAKALLALSVLTSAEAMAQNGFLSRDAHSLNSTSAESYRSFRADSPRITNPHDSRNHIKATQGKGPVDVMSLSLCGALACFFGLAMVRRQKLRRAGRRLDVSLPEARVIPSRNHNTSDMS